MQPNIVSGQAIGTVVSATSSTDLASINTQGLAIGTKAWNVAVGAYFTLTLSTAALVTDSVVAVSGLTGARWIVDAGAVIADGSVTTAKLAANAVTGAKVNGTSVTAALNPATAALQGLSPGLDPWYVTAVQAAQALGMTEWTVLVPPPGTPTQSAPVDPGVDGGALSATATLYLSSSYMLQNSKANNWYYKTRFQQSVLSSAGVAANWGLSNGAGHRLFLTDGTTGPIAGNWFVQLYSGSSVVTADTGVVANTSWNTLEIYRTAANSGNVIYKINGVQVASVANTQMPTTPTVPAMVVQGAMTMRTRKAFFAFDGSTG